MLCNLEKYKKKELYLGIGILFIFCMMMFSNKISNVVSASSETIVKEEKRFISVKIESGDTLWSIASDYYHVSGQDGIKAYIKEIKSCNGLQSNTIHEGRYLVIPYLEAVISK